MVGIAPFLRNIPPRTTRKQSLSRSTRTNIFATHSVSKAAKPSKIPAGKVVRAFFCKDLPVSRKQQRADHTRRGVSWKSITAAAHGQETTHCQPVDVHKNTFADNCNDQDKRVPIAAALASGRGGRSGDTLTKRRAPGSPVHMVGNIPYTLHATSLYGQHGNNRYLAIREQTSSWLTAAPRPSSPRRSPPAKW